MSSVPKYISNFYHTTSPSASPSGKRVRYESSSAWQVASYFLAHQEQMEELEPEDRYALAKRMVAVKEDSPEIPIFKQHILGALDVEDVLDAVDERNLVFAFEILDNLILKPEEIDEIEEAVCKIDWSIQLNDPEFFKMMGKIQIALNPRSRKICQTLVLQNNNALNLLSGFRDNVFPEVDIFFSNPSKVEFTQLLGKDRRDRSLTEEDMQKVYQSAYLRNILFDDYDFKREMVRSRIDTSWFSLMDRMGKLGDHAERYGLFCLALSLKDMERIHLFLNFLPSLEDLIVEAPNELLMNDFAEEDRDRFLSRFQIISIEKLFEFGSESTIEYYLSTRFADIPTPLADEWMKSYLQNKLFSSNFFHQMFHVNEDRICNLRNEDDYSYTQTIMDHRPEVVVEVLKRHLEELSYDDVKECYEMHLDGPISMTACFNLDLVALLYDHDQPEIEKDILEYINYHRGDLQRTFIRYPKLRKTFLKELRDYKGLIMPALKADIIEVYRDEIFEDNSNIFHLLARKLFPDAFIELLQSSDLQYLQVTNNQGLRPFDCVPIMASWSSKSVNKLMALSKDRYSVLFNQNLKLLSFCIKQPHLFKIFIQQEPYLIEHFKRPLNYANSSNESMEQTVFIDDLYRYLLIFTSDEIDKLIECGLIFDPSAGDSAGDTFFHGHPTYLRGFETAMGRVNTRGQTPLWNPKGGAVRNFLKKGADPTHLSQDGSNFLHAYRIKNKEDLVIFSLLGEKCRQLLLQKNVRGEMALMSLLRSVDSDPNLFLQVIEASLPSLIPAPPYIESTLLNQILSFEERYMDDDQVAPLPDKLNKFKTDLWNQVLENLEIYRPLLKDIPLVLRACLIQCPDRFTLKEFIEFLKDNPPLVLIEYLFSKDDLPPDLFHTFQRDQLLRILPLLSADTIREVLNYTFNDHLTEETWDELHDLIAKALSAVKEMERDQNHWVSATQEELKAIPIEQTALFARAFPQPMIELLPYFYTVQQAIIIPLLPIPQFRDFILKQPLEKRSEYILYATTEQKNDLFACIVPHLLPESFKTWDKGDWHGKTKYDLASLNQIKHYPINSLRQAFLRNVGDPLKARFAAEFAAAQQRFDQVKQEVEEVFAQLPLGEQIPEQWIDPLTLELIVDPVRIPGNPPLWLSKSSWIAYQKFKLNYMTKDDQGRLIQLPPGEIKHPTQARPVRIEECRDDPECAREIQEWQRIGNSNR